MKCKHCGSETGKLVKFPKLGIEVDFEQEQNGKEFSEIIIPEGWRLLRIGEVVEVMEYAVKNKLDIWSWFEQPIKVFRGKYSARFIADSDRALLGCGRNLWVSNSSLGVIFCREIKKVRK